MIPFKIGHYTDIQRGTGCTVILCPDETRASACARGVSPGTREFALLSPFRKVEYINALLLTGGTAFGLDAAAGIMRFLSESGRGHPTPFGNIPIVPAAVIYDRLVLDSQAYPLAEHAYQACETASVENNLQGCVGAGTGATIGKWAGLEYMMKGGIGKARLEESGVWTVVLSVVNPVGDVIDPEGKIVAGAIKNGKFIARENTHARWKIRSRELGPNTILVAVMTNVLASKVQLHYLAERAHNGIVRAVIPAHTSFDGDIIFTLTTGQKACNIDLMAEMVVETTRQSIVNAALNARSIGGIPCAKPEG